MLALTQQMGDTLVIKNMQTGEVLTIKTVMVADSHGTFMPSAKTKVAIDSPEMYKGKPKYNVSRINRTPDDVKRLLDLGGDKRAVRRIDSDASKEMEKYNNGIDDATGRG